MNLARQPHQPSSLRKGVDQKAAIWPGGRGLGPPYGATAIGQGPGSGVGQFKGKTRHFLITRVDKHVACTRNSGPTTPIPRDGLLRG